MRNFHFLAPIAAIAIALPAPALAQDATALATQLVDMLTPAQQTRAGVTTQLKAMREGQLVRAMLSQNPQFRAEAAKNQPSFNAAIIRMGAAQADAVGPVMLEAQAASRQSTINAYAQAFTAAELKQIVAFYNSPVGVKLRKTQPEIGRQTAQEAQKRFAPRLEAANKSVSPKIEAELKKLFPNAGAPK